MSKMSETHKPEKTVEERKISTPDVKESNAVRWIIFIFLFILLLIAIPIVKNKINKSRSEEPSTSNSVGSSNDLPVEYHTLKKGAEPVRVIIPPGYDCDYFGGGKKYYHQSQNGPKEIWGGGSCPSGLGNPNASYADLSCYDEEITVTCKIHKK